MSWGRGLAVRLERLHLQRPAYRIWEWQHTLSALPEVVFRSRRRGSDGLPLPPPILRVQVTGTARADEFMAQSYRAAETIHDVIGRVGRDLEGFEAILD